MDHAFLLKCAVCALAVQLLFIVLRESKPFWVSWLVKLADEYAAISISAACYRRLARYLVLSLRRRYQHARHA